MKILLILLAIIISAGLFYACKSKKEKTTQNKCIDKSKIDPNGICTMEWAPVCGCDGKTYSNACMAEKSGVTKWTQGECKPCIDKSKISTGPCTKEYMPVCGCDGKQYANKCLAKRAGVTQWTEGPCK